MIYTISQILTHSAQRVPENTAFDSGSESITFSEADQQTNQIANFLIENGLKKGDRVGLFLKRNVKSALAVHGVLKSGGAFVPIDVDAPAERIQYILDDCNIHYLITEESLTNHVNTALESFPKELVILGVDLPQTDYSCFSRETLHDYPTHTPGINIQSSDLAYIMYTSGTTGFPKGIMHTHYSCLSYAKLSRDLYDISDADVVANHSPLHFDMSTFGYITAPMAGATTIILGKQYSVFPASLSQLIEQKKITVWYSVPLVLQQLLERGDLKNRDFTSMRWVLFGGEPFPVHQLNRFMAHCPNASFSNVYGPAEVNQCTFYNRKGKETEYETLPLGEVWNDTDHLILNENQDRVKQGEIGELLIHSSTMMAGYWNHEERTRKSILEVEVHSGLKKRFYKTGDLVKEDENGVLFFIGRKDRQIKSRGHRIELNEIEETILRLGEVEQVACYTYTLSGINEIFATVVLTSGTSIENLNHKIQKSLPKYSIPKLILETEKLPRTSAGKVDYKKLKENIRSIYDSKN
ncbi:amino acid adenylation domain-containing protein [Rhodohalobacter sulfatireducens]|uniref:Amino acid adenylation domain-containing protein n=1 Tax=Rhodohalobacter sulfatireducens TaxID=2911366 RepID=A0ABS9KIY0_9BACT|nr:amino acid adenylation domain-containing protein [Rhodohalobacter sulfatireducens]MCG2590808.1 amino acid adenylation domain-containing protein [Rhodohalobacter sulfatireducens]